MKFTDEEARQAPFTDDDLFFWKNLCGNHLTDEENLEIHPMTLRDILARLECAEKVVEATEPLITNEQWINLDIAKEAWRKAAGKL